MIGLLPIYRYNQSIIKLVITTSEPDPVEFTVSSLDETLYTGTVTAGTPTNITDNNDTLSFYIVSSESDRYKGILVTTGSQKKISLIVALAEFHGWPGCIGAYLAYPAWGYPVISYVYYAVSTSMTINSILSSLLIVSANNNTNITITPSVTVTIPSDLSPTGSDTILNAGQSITIQLQYLETLLLKPVTALAELSGTKVESNKPISVYSGLTYGNVPTNYGCKFVGEQIPPVASWGDEFLIHNLGYRSILKLIGSQDSTRVSIACNKSRAFSLSLQEGAVLSQNINQTNCYITSTEPILVAQFTMGMSIGGFIVDPTMKIIPPLHHYTNNVTSLPLFTLFQYEQEFWLINLAVLAGSDSSQIRLNGNLLPSLSSSS